MPKKKAREEGAGAPAQAKPHNRGGTRRVKDTDKTNTPYDDMNRQQLEQLTKDYDIYIKDSKKAEMAKRLAAEDQRKETERRAAQRARENVKKRQEALEERERQALKRAKDQKRRRNAARQKRRANGEQDVSPDEFSDQETELQRAKYAEQRRIPDVADINMEHKSPAELRKELLERMDGGVNLGVLLSDTCTETDSSTDSEMEPNQPSNRIRLFEWTGRIGQELVSASSSEEEGDQHEIRQTVNPKGFLRQIDYATLRVLTTKNKTKQFPGQRYLPGVDEDSAPVLDAETRYAARNGILKGALREAIIEKATDWALQTKIDGATGCMFFKPRPPSKYSRRTQREVYRKYNEANRKLLKVDVAFLKSVHNVEELVNERSVRHAKRRRNRGLMTKEAYDASKYQPQAICYLPAYLNYSKAPLKMLGDLENRTLDTLFYMRFKGCDVPHYFFWIHKGHWPDPTIPNPKWLGPPSTNSVDSSKRLVRVKGEFTPPTQEAQSLLSRKENKIVERAHHYERDLHRFGLMAVLSAVHRKHESHGKAGELNRFIKSLMMLYPNANLPTGPPIHSKGIYSIAYKLACLDILGNLSPLWGLTASDPWTSRDDELWPIEEEEVEDEEQTESHTDVDDVESDAEEQSRAGLLDAQSLYRRRSSAMTEAWLAGLDSSSLSVVDVGLETEQEDFQKEVHTGMDLVCPFCTQNLQGLSLHMQAAHMHCRSPLQPAFAQEAFMPFASRDLHRNVNLDTDRSVSVTDADMEIQVSGSNTHAMIVRASTRTAQRRKSVEMHVAYAKYWVPSHTLQ